jgi:arylsulfatase A-like enzyme
VPDVAGLPDSYEAVPPHYAKAIPEYLRAAGYYCTNNWKTDYQFDAPISTHHECGGDAHWRSESRGDDQPFFSVFNFVDTHSSAMFPGDDGHIDAPGNLTVDPDEVDVPPYLPDTEPTRRAIARHYTTIEAADERVGDLLDQLAADGHADNTVVMLWSDHGSGIPRAKGWPYHVGIHVPLLVRWPGEIEPGTVDESLVSMVDLGPTTLSIAGVDVPRHMHGWPFLGPEADDNDRAYVYATRDRAGESYDMVRTVFDGRFQYVRNYYPGTPYVSWVSYRNQHPALRELHRLSAAGELTEAQGQWFGGTRPAEELYDLESDPHQLDNLADRPDYAETLDRLRSALDGWLDRVGETGHRSESEIRDSGWPNGEQPTTVPPTFVPNAAGNRGDRQIADRAELDAPATLRLYCATQGASIVYSTGDPDRDPESQADWALYTSPIDLPDEAAETAVRAKAVRYGYAPSDTAEVTISLSE